MTQQQILMQLYELILLACLRNDGFKAVLDLVHSQLISRQDIKYSPAR